MKQRVEFGTDGIQSLVGKFPLHRAVVGPIGKAFGQFACRRSDRPTVIIGHDTRPSSVWIADGLVAGLVSQGVDVIQLGIVTTPGVAFVLRRQAADMGLVISASHCPLEYNGIKAMASRGLRLKRVEEIEIERLIEHCIEHEPPALPRLGEIVEGQHLIDQYIRDHVWPD